MIFSYVCDVSTNREFVMMLLLGVLCLISSALALPYKEVYDTDNPTRNVEEFQETVPVIEKDQEKRHIKASYAVPPPPELEPLEVSVIEGGYDTEKHYDHHGESDAPEDEAYKFEDEKIVLLEINKPSIVAKFTIPLPFPFPNINVPLSFPSFFSKPRYIYPSYRYRSNYIIV